MKIIILVHGGVVQGVRAEEGLEELDVEVLDLDDRECASGNFEESELREAEYEALPVELF